MAKGDLVTAAELLIRRFDPTKEVNYTKDDAGLPSHLRQSGLRFDDEDGILGCSVYQDSKLTHHKLTRRDCIESLNPHWEIAAATVAAVLAAKRKAVPTDNPFSVVEDPLPDGAPPPHARDYAHALITHPRAVAGSDKWYQVVAWEFTVAAAYAT